MNTDKSDPAERHENHLNQDKLRECANFCGNDKVQQPPQQHL